METSLITFVDHSNAQGMIIYSKHNTNVQKCIRQMIWMKTVITVIFVDVFSSFVSFYIKGARFGF